MPCVSNKSNHPEFENKKGINASISEKPKLMWLVRSELRVVGGEPFPLKHTKDKLN
jgi:hypothetical protein